MPSSDCEGALRERVAEAARDEGCVLLELNLRQRGKVARLEITVDRAEGVSVDECARISRRLSRSFEDEPPLAGAYVLEVGSPGLDRQLASDAEYEHFAGRPVVVELRTAIEAGAAGTAGKAATRLTGVLQGLDDAGHAVLLVDTSGEQRSLPLSAIAATRLDFEAAIALRKAATSAAQATAAERAS
jgi:ribosome maturation factor RimP